MVLDGAAYTGVSLLLAFLVGAIPFSQIVARAARGADLRRHGAGTVSGTGVYEVAGAGPLVVAGVLDVAKGAAAPLMAWEGPHSYTAAVAAGCAVLGHNWSPFLRGAGGRGVSVALGSTAVVAWPGAVVLTLGLGLGRLAGATGLGCFLSYAALAPVLWATSGGTGLVLAGSLLTPIIAKRLAGNGPTHRAGVRTYLARLLYDREPAGAERQESPVDSSERPRGV